MLVHVLVLNHNGRRLLAECLPSVLDAAAASRHDCRVAVIDNDSSDGSVAWLAEHLPGVEVIRRPNRVLVSFNDVVAALSGKVAILLNNDVKLDRRAIDPLVEPLVEEGFRVQGSGFRTLTPQRCFMTAPRCLRFDGATYEGLKAAVLWRFGLVEATAFFEGHERVIDLADLTAAAGSVLAVDRRIFTELGGFDPVYLPGRLEDLDFAYRGYLAGCHALYVPEALAYHLGMGTFGEAYGRSGCDLLALRNTLLFQWKHLRHPLHVLRQAVGLPARLVLDVLRAAWLPAPRRFLFTRALVAALARAPQIVRACQKSPTSREREFFRRFHPRRMAEVPGTRGWGLGTGRSSGRAVEPEHEVLNPEPRTLNPLSS